MYILSDLKIEKFFYIVIIFVLGCSSNKTSNDINPVIVPKEEQVSRLNSDNKFSSLNSPETLKSKYKFGKVDPFNESTMLNSILIPSDFTLKGTFGDQKDKYAILNYRGNFIEVAEGDIGGKTNKDIPLGMIVKSIDIDLSSVVLEQGSEEVNLVLYD